MHTSRHVLGPGGHIARQLPGYEHRAPQLAMADLVERAIADGTHAAVEAGTGTGKSLAYLVPAILSRKTTIVSTADKSLQEQICVAPETRILTADLRYIQAAEVCEGMALVGFDEERVGHRRHFHEARVTAVARIRKPSYRLTFDDGTVITCSEDHQWLCGRSTNGIRWLTTKQMMPATGAREGSPVIRLCDTWGTDSSYEAGYLAAAFDGEGHLTQQPSRSLVRQGQNGVINKLGFSQNDNEMLATVREYLAAKGFGVTERINTVKGVSNTRLYLRSRADLLRFLGAIRPPRLLAKLNLDLLGTISVRERGALRHTRLIRKEFVGETEVMAITTTTGTYVAEGLASHNCNKDIPFLQSVMPVPFRAALLKGRSNYPCLYRVGMVREQVAGVLAAEFGFRTPEAAAAWPAFNRWVSDLESSGEIADCEKAPFSIPSSLLPDVTITSEECLGERCPVKARCIAERAKEAARRANVVIVNHALLLLDLKLRRESEGAATVLPDADVVVLDECHHLQDKATDTFGVEVSEYTFRDLERKIVKLLTRSREGREELTEEGQTALAWQEALADAGSRLNAYLYSVRERLESVGATVQRLGDEWPAPGPVIEGLHALALRMQQQCPPTLEAEQRDLWGKYVGGLQSLAVSLEQLAVPNDDETVRFAKLDGPPDRRRLLLCLKRIDIAPVLREALWSQFRTVIATSATIATDGNIRYWRQTVGMDEARELVLPSPFDYRRNALLYLPPDERKFDPSARWGGDGSLDYLERLSAEIERLILASHGRAFVLFTSYRTLLDVYDRLSPRLSRFLVLRQGELSRPELVKRFREHGAAVLFGTRSFWEGVDIQGEALSLVVIDKLPFVPPDDPVFDARKEKITRETGDQWAWFGRLAIPYATIALKQGVGRLIRSQSDRGVIALLDGRLSFKPYGTRIVRSLPPAVKTRSLDAVRAFFAAEAEEAAS